MVRPVDPLFGQFEHDRAAHHRGDTEWLAAAWQRGQVVVVTPEGQAPIEDGPRGPQLQWRKPSEVDDEIPPIFLGLLGETPLFCVRARRDERAERWADLRNIGERLSVADRGVLVEAVALCQWHERHSKCPICGADTVPREAGWSTRCPVDDTPHFPRTDPAVIMLVHDGADRCVLGRQAVWPEGRFSILAGFVEPGESLEAAVAREVLEEVGLNVTDISYVGSQPWPFPASIMLGFVARVDGPDKIVAVDGEIAEAHWFTRDEVNGLFGWGDAGASDPGARSMPGQISIAHHIMKAWAEGQFAELTTTPAAAQPAAEPPAPKMPWDLDEPLVADEPAAPAPAEEAPKRPWEL